MGFANSDRDKHTNAARVALDSHVTSLGGGKICSWLLLSVSFVVEIPEEEVHNVHKARQKGCLDIISFMANLSVCYIIIRVRFFYNTLFGGVYYDV